MKFWIDAQLPPTLAQQSTQTFSVEAFSLKDLNLREIFDKAKIADVDNIVIITKDRDFIELVNRFDSPPQILWVTCGNVTNRYLKLLFTNTFTNALQLLEAGEKIVEITDQGLAI